MRWEGGREVSSRAGRFGRDDESGEGLNRRSLLVGAAACVLCAAVGARPAGAAAAAPVVTRTMGARRKTQPDAVFRVATKQRMVALTFDDGPDPEYTPHVLEVLRRFDAQATFFLVGVNAAAYPELVAAQRAAGHSHGNHTFDHPDLETLGRDGVDAEISGAAQSIRAAGGRIEALFRPPYGYTDQAVAAAAKHQGYRTVFWSECVESHLHHHRVGHGVAALTRSVRPGSIILAHDGGTIVTQDHHLNRDRTLQALPMILEHLTRKGFAIAGLPTLLRHDHR